MRQLFQVLRVTRLSGPEGVRAVFNFSLEKGSTLPFAPVCTTSKDSLTRILKLRRLGLTTVLTHDDVKILEKYLLCKEESVQFDLFKIQHAGGAQSENEKKALEAFNMFQAGGNNFFNTTFSSNQAHNHFDINDTLAGLDSELMQTPMEELGKLYEFSVKCIRALEHRIQTLGDQDISFERNNNRIYRGLPPHIPGNLWTGKLLPI